MISSSRLVTSLLCSLLTAVLLGACGGGDPPKKTLISEARASPNGTLVHVEGLVTVPSGRFNSSTEDQGFAIQDESGGIYVTTQALNGLQLGDWVRFDAERVTGPYSRQIELAPLGGIERLGGSSLVKPLDKGTGAIDEGTGGKLVRVSGRVRVDDLPDGDTADLIYGYIDDRPYGYKFFIDDGSGQAKIFVNIASGSPVIALELLRVGAVVQVTGFVYEYDGVLEVSPRQASDLFVLSSPPP